MTYQEALTEIANFIVANGNNEITADVLRPILEGIVQACQDTTGDLNDLDTSEKSNLVAAINEVLGMFSTDTGNVVRTHNGVNDPNAIAPVDFGFADFYLQYEALTSVPIALYQYNILDNQWRNIFEGSDAVPNLQEVTDQGSNTSNIITVQGLGVQTLTPAAAIDASKTKTGVLVSLVTEAQRDAITVGAPQNGILVFVTDASEPGFQFYDHASTSWKAVASGNFIPIGGTNENDPVTGLIEFESGSDRGFFSINPEIIDRRVVFSDEDDIRIRTQRLDEELQTAVFVRPGSFEVSTNDLNNSSNLSINPTESLLTSTNASYRGLEYGGNYSANFSPRSLVDKEYVDNAATTNLSYTPSTTEGTVNSDTGTDATIPAGSTTNASLMLPGDKTSLDIAKAVNGLVKSDGSGSFSAASSSDFKTVNGQSVLGPGSISTGDVVGPASSTDNTVPRFDGATGKLIQGSTVAITDAGEVLLPQVASPTYTRGKLAYDTSNEALTFFNDESNVALQVGQEAWIRVRNQTGSTIPNGSAVYINGSSSGLPTIALAQANNAATTVCAGITTHSIPNNAVGYVTSLGAVRNLNTSSFATGSIFLSATTPGALTQTAPSSPNYRYRVGFVTNVNATTGTIHVTPSTAALGNGTSGQLLRISSGGIQEFFTPNYAPGPSWMRQSADRTLVSQTAPQKIFNVGANGNGAFQAKANTSYHFVIMAGFNSLSNVSSTLSFVFLGTASIPTIYATAQAVKNNNNPSNTSTTKIISNVETTITGSSATTSGRILIEGYFTTGTAGTVIPALGQSSAAAGVVETNSFARFVEVGSSTFTASSDID